MLVQFVWVNDGGTAVVAAVVVVAVVEGSVVAAARMVLLLCSQLHAGLIVVVKMGEQGVEACHKRVVNHSCYFHTCTKADGAHRKTLVVAHILGTGSDSLVILDLNDHSTCMDHSNHRFHQHYSPLEHLV